MSDDDQQSILDGIAARQALREIERRLALQPSLSELVEAAREIKMTAAQAEAQRRSFTFGNVSMHNPDVTREMVDEAAERLAKEEGGR